MMALRIDSQDMMLNAITGFAYPYWTQTSFQMR